MKDYARLIAESDPVTVSGGCCDASYHCFFCSACDSDCHDSDCTWVEARTGLGLRVDLDRHINEDECLYLRRKEAEADVAQYGPIDPIQGPLTWQEEQMASIWRGFSSQIYGQFNRSPPILSGLSAALSTSNTYATPTWDIDFGTKDE